jgi:glutathione peroxidase
MQTSVLAWLSVVSLAGISYVLAAEDAKSAEKPVPAVLNYTMKSLAGEDVKLSQFQGKVILIINTASECGFTPQYEGLQALYTKYKDKGLVLLGFPANDFGQQEPGTDSQIATFCKENYGVRFPMFSKISVLGNTKAPLYQYLTDARNDPTKLGEVQWNFEKFLISKDGKIVNRWRSATTPQSDEVVKAIEAELAK